MSIVNTIYRHVRLDQHDEWMTKPVPKPPLQVAMKSGTAASGQPTASARKAPPPPPVHTVRTLTHSGAPSVPSTHRWDTAQALIKHYNALMSELTALGKQLDVAAAGVDGAGSGGGGPGAGPIELVDDAVVDPDSDSVVSSSTWSSDASDTSLSAWTATQQRLQDAEERLQQFEMIGWAIEASRRAADDTRLETGGATLPPSANAASDGGAPPRSSPLSHLPPEVASAALRWGRHVAQVDASRVGPSDASTASVPHATQLAASLLRRPANGDVADLTSEAAGVAGDAWLGGGGGDDPTLAPSAQLPVVPAGVGMYASGEDLGSDGWRVDHDSYRQWLDLEVPLENGDSWEDCV